MLLVDDSLFFLITDKIVCTQTYAFSGKIAIRLKFMQMIKVGFIGLNPDSQWASRSHVPALKSLSGDFVITGVANSTYESAKRTADVLQIPHAFENAQALIASPEVDLVVITVRVPYHFELVKAALEAGKHVYCEHPLGNGLAETRALAEIAAAKNVVAVTGTQMVVAPEIVYLQKLIAEGYAGRVLSTTLIGSGGGWRNEAAENASYLFDKTNGATMLTIPLAHTLAGVQKVLGGIDTLTACMTSNFHEVKIKETGEVKVKTAEDQIMVIGTLKSGAAITIHYRGGTSRGTNLLWEINGTEGDIQITAPLGHGQLAPLTIKGARGEEKELKPLSLPEGNPAVENVKRMYELIAGDIKNSTGNAPGFQDAVSLYEILEAIERSSKNF